MTQMQMQALLQELEHEAVATRRTLERVPAGQHAWKPHEKSMTMGRLANHVAEIPLWATMTLLHDELDMAPKDGQPYETPSLATSAELVAAFDRNLAGAREAFEKAQDAELARPWTLKGGDQVYFTMPKGAVLRSFVFSHLVHHRAQLGVYLRLKDVPVPSVYGPSADESGM